MHEDQRGNCKCARSLRAGRCFEGSPAPQHRIRGLGDEGAIALAEIAVLPEVSRDRLVGRTVEPQQLDEQRLDVIQQRG